MQSISYIARDGLKIHGYLTLPLDKNDGPLPMIVMPHGGPFARYEWGFNAEVQFLASRGYAVLQINYRGSTGYGRYYRETARGQFGKKVQDDITDGVYWAINEKIADPERIAIFGGSFGGYMALCGLTFTPDLYKCAISFAGVYDWVAMFDQLKRKKYRNYSYDLLKPWFGDPQKDKDIIRGISPINYVDQIKVPVLIVHGRSDYVVDTLQAKNLITALKKAKKSYKVYLQNWEGHGFIDEKKRFKFYSKVEDFLEKNL